jgi:SAM-dependent methyltransferase
MNESVSRNRPAANHARINRAAWDATADSYQRDHHPQLSDNPMKWGVWGIPESRLSVLGDVGGKDVLELGCGAALWSIALASIGASAVGMDLSERQLAHARRLIADDGSRIPLVAANGEFLPFGDSSFDVVFCDYGAMTFADPYAAVPEAARVLRAGGLFAFCTTSPLFSMCQPDGAEHPTPQLAADYFGLHEIRYVEDEGLESVEFQLPYSEWVALFRSCGFLIDALIEPRPPENAQSTYRTDDDLEWARRWPMECIWKLRLG